jgi:hypothetical protein
MPLGLVKAWSLARVLPLSRASRAWCNLLLCRFAQSLRAAAESHEHTILKMLLMATCLHSTIIQVAACMTSE